MKGLWNCAWSYPAALFYLAVAAGLAQGDPHDHHPLCAQLITWTIYSAVASWLIADAHRFGLGHRYDHDTFLAITWLISGPVQLLRTRGWRGVFPIGAFAVIMSAGTILGYLLAGVGN